jgi:hypothetical protein
MTVIEKEYSMNNFQISIAIKSVIAQVVNSIIVPILVNFYIKDRNIFGKSGLVEDIFILGITSSLVPPLVRLFDPYNIFLHIRYKYYSH